jgi:D-glycero-alpha-D-manno-heptose 1-phosphate guanylyltransferase
VKVIVLCGGLGTRLGDLTRDTPKPMLSVGGRPFIAHVLDRLCTDSIEGIILAAGFSWPALKDFIGDQWRGKSVEYSVEPEAMGTGGAISLAMRSYNLAQALIVNGDTLFDIDLDIFLKDFKQPVATRIALREVKDCSRYGRVTLDSNYRITSFGENGYFESGLINGGIYLQQYEPLLAFGDRAYSFENDYLAPKVTHLRMEGVRFNDYFIDIGIPEDLQRAEIELSGTHIEKIP